MIRIMTGSESRNFWHTHISLKLQLFRQTKQRFICTFTCMLHILALYFKIFPFRFLYQLMELYSLITAIFMDAIPLC